jgi:thiol-disulfide isomerase/thioredoxin
MQIRSNFRNFLQKHSNLFLNVLFFAAVFIAVSMFQTRNMLPSSGSTPPSLTGPLLRGGTFDLEAGGERPALIYFFAPWCNFCAASSDNLTRLRRMRDKDSLDILTVVLDWKDLGEVQDYVGRHDLDLPVILGDRQVAQDWHVMAFPTYYVLDSKHRIRRRDLGYSTQFGLWWRTWLVD